MSAVLDARGKLVAGSLICQQSDKSSVDNHALMVGAVNLLQALDDLGPSNSGKTFASAEFFKKNLTGK